MNEADNREAKSKSLPGCSSLPSSSSHFSPKEGKTKPIDLRTLRFSSILAAQKKILSKFEELRALILNEEKLNDLELTITGFIKVYRPYIWHCSKLLTKNFVPSSK